MTLLLDAYCASAGLGAVVTAPELAASGSSASTPELRSDGSIRVRRVRVCGDEQVRPDARVETRIRARAGMGAGAAA